MVEGQDPPVRHHLPAVDEDVAHRPVGGVEHQAAQRVVQRPHPGVAQVHQHDVRLHPRRQPADVVAHQRRRPADGRGMEHLVEGGRLNVAARDPREGGDLAHLLDHVVGAAVGADAHGHARAHVVAEVLHQVRVARERRRAVRHRRAAVGEDAEVLVRHPADPGMPVEEHGVAKDRARRQHAEVVRPLDRGAAVAAQDFLHLPHALGRVERVGDLALAGRVEGVAQEVGGAVLDLRGGDDAGQAAGGLVRQPVDEGERGVQPLAPRRLVPGEVEPVIDLQLPGPRAEGGGEEAAQAALREEVGPAGEQPADVHQGGDAGEQELAGRRLEPRLHVLVAEAAEGLAAFVEAGHVVVAHAVLLAQAALDGLVLRVGVDVDEAGHDHQLAAADRVLRLAGEAGADVDDAVVREGHVDVAGVDVARAGRVPDDGPGGVADEGGRHGRLRRLARKYGGFAGR